MIRLNRCHNIYDLRELARKRLPRTFFDYIEGGAEDEVTLRRNARSFERYEFVPRVLIDVSQIDLKRSMLGSSSTMPVILAPTGMSRMFHHEGEQAVARAAEAFGLIYTLSTVATSSIEQIAPLAGNKSFQIYVWNDLEIVEDFIKRCQQQGYNSLMLAVDSPTLGNRERDVRNGHGRPVKQRIMVGLQAITRPSWLFRFIVSPSQKLANLTAHLPPGESLYKSLDAINGQFDPRLNWSAIKYIRDRWDGSLILKGIQSVADAKIAADHGVDGIVLSNHGGRQLDGAPTSLRLLPEVVEHVKDRVDIFIDGGIRRGSDIIKAVALGAKAVLIGRSYLYGLAAGGEKGVTRSLQILHDEMVRVMMLIGCPTIDQLDASYVELIDDRAKCV